MMSVTVLVAVHSQSCYTTSSSSSAVGNPFGTILTDNTIL